MAYYEFIFETPDTERKEILIAILHEAGFTGFEETETSLKSYIRQEDFDDAVFNELANTHSFVFEKSTIEERNWNQSWEANFEPVTVLLSGSEQPFAHIRASFHPVLADAVHDILVTPKMSFGTGHHPTTHMMIAWMSKLDFSGKTVIDFGTGTGVLSILAEKMGASTIFAIDYDEWSISNARENTEANHCTAIQIIRASTINLETKADVILANINLNVIVENLETIKAHCKNNAILLFSGILYDDLDALNKCLHATGLRIMDTETMNNWLSVMATEI
jgi:ribosomal protein L11 methyltransferase